LSVKNISGTVGGIRRTFQHNATTTPQPPFRGLRQ
jgi:hypothetical protein